MNKVILIGRLTADPDIRVTPESETKIAQYSIAVDRRFKKDGEPGADFIPCIAFQKGADFAEKYLVKGMKVAIVGRLQVSSYKNKNGENRRFTDVIIETQEFVQPKAENGVKTQISASDAKLEDDFVKVPEGIDEELPFI